MVRPNVRRSENETIRAVIEWKQEGKRSRDRPRKGWLDVIEEDLKALGVQEWEQFNQDQVGGLEGYSDGGKNSKRVINANEEIEEEKNT